jgi:hypothetical protein
LWELLAPPPPPVSTPGVQRRYFRPSTTTSIMLLTNPSLYGFGTDPVRCPCLKVTGVTTRNLNLPEPVAGVLVF